MKKTTKSIIALILIGVLVIFPLGSMLFNYFFGLPWSSEAACLELDDSFAQYDCFLYFASVKGDETICETVPTETDELLNTKFWCYYQVALGKEDYSLCEKAKFEDNLGQCYAYIGFAKGETDICESLDQEFVRGWCYTYIAYLTNDETLCEIIPEQVVERPQASFGGSYENPKDRCYFYQDNCDKIKDIMIRSWCEVNQPDSSGIDYELNTRD